MPRIRKKTSKRGTSTQRERIKHKATEQRKKNKRDAKRNPQWKSKHPKDPGIPNNFPFKDEVLAEIAEQRRKVEEEKTNRKEARKAAKAASKQAPSGDAESDDDGENISDSGLDGVLRITAGTSSAATKKATKPAPIAEDEDEVPTLINPDLPNLQAVLAKADVVIEVLDARNPLAYRSAHLEEAIAAKAGRKTLLVLSKIDACPREAVFSWAARLREDHPTILFRSADAFLPREVAANPKGKGKEPADNALGASSVLSCLGTWAEQKTDGAPLTVAVVGVTNSGKSAFINSLARRAAIPVYKLPTLSAPSHSPTTTEHPHEVTLDVAGKTIHLIDTPGLSFESPSTEDAEHIRARDILLRSKGRIDRLKDPLPPVAEIIARANTEDLMLFYNLPAFSKGNLNAFLAALARANGLVKKGGALDLANAARLVLRDWSTGKFPRYTVPPAGASPPAATSDDVTFAAAYVKDEGILASLQMRKDLRKGAGVVRLLPGEVETRNVVLDAPWIRVHGEPLGNDDDDGAEVGEEEEAEEDLREEGEEAEEPEDEEDLQENSDEDEDEEEAPAPVPAGKRKRQEKLARERPSKKVAFARTTSSSKAVRSAKSTEAPPKSAMKTISKPSLKAKLPIAKKPRAAASTKKAGPGKDGEELYDFTKFF